MPSVYIESTIPSFYFETRTARIVQTWRDFTRQWWDTHRHNYKLVTSRFVLRELAETPSPKSTQCLDLVIEAEILNEPPGLRKVIQYYMANMVMPKDAMGDAAHLAMASMHGLDFLVTWNCRHLANANKARHISTVNARLKLTSPVITTPVMLLPEAEH